MNNVERLPLSILDSVRENLGIEPGETEFDDRINKMSNDEILRRCGEWNCIADWGLVVKGWINSIYGIDIDKLATEGRSD